MNSNGQEDGLVQRCEKSSESLESNVSYVCCKPKKVSNKCSGTENGKSYCCKMKCKTVDVCPSDHCEQPVTINKIRGKLSCIIEKLNHLIDTYPSETKPPNDGSAAADQQPGSTDTKNNPPGEVSDPKPSCDKLPAENGGGKPLRETVTPADTNETPVPPETKVEPTPEPKTADTPKEQNTDTPTIIDTDNKSCSELQSNDSCTDEVEKKNQKLDSCITDGNNNNNNNNGNVIKDDETNKNIGADDGAANAKSGVKTIKNIYAEAAAKPKSPVPVKTIRNQTKPNSGNKQLPVKCVDQNKMKRNSRNIQSSSSDKKSINKR